MTTEKGSDALLAEVADAVDDGVREQDERLAAEEQRVSQQSLPAVDDEPGQDHPDPDEPPPGDPPEFDPLPPS